MVRILTQVISFLILLVHFSCRSNHTERKEESPGSGAAVTLKKHTVPVAVSAMELCAHFNSNAGEAVTKYQDHILMLAGTVALSEATPVDNNCCDIIMNCDNTDKRETGTLSIVIRHCSRDEVSKDTISPGKTINIHCRFIAYQDGVIQMEEVAAPE